MTVPSGYSGAGPVGSSGPPEGWGERGVALADCLVALADTLPEEFDVSELAGRLVESSLELLGAAAAGLLLRDGEERLRLAASTGEESRLLELFQLQSEKGPCLDSFRTSRQVAVDSLPDASGRWPEFVEAAGSLGFTSAYAFPLRLRGHTVGALNLFYIEPAALDDRDRRIGQALADTATIGLLQHERRHRATRLAEQLQGALHSRVVIEQAKGVLAEYAGIDMDAAFEAIRRYSRDHNRRLAEVAGAVVRRTLRLDSVVGARRTQ